MSSSSVMWVEKYRPQKISELINQKEIVGSINSMLKNQSELPHLLFSGSAGVGKTSAALCVSREILGKHWRDYTLELNASDERGINMVRERVKKFSRFAGLDTEIPFKIIILDEADEMTADAQTALRRITEDTAKICRFILIANNLSKIIKPIQSRCVVFKFTKISDKEILSQLKFIGKKEKIKADEKGLNAICDYTDGDLRHAINIFQAAASSGNVTESVVKSIVGLTKTLAMELGKFNIRVNAVCPGTIKGDRMKRVIKAKAKLMKVSQKLIEKDFISMSSLKSWVTEEDIGNACAFLISNEASKISGQVIAVDGNTEKMD